MSDDSLGSISIFFQQLQNGDRAASREVWLRYFPRLSGLARRILNGSDVPVSAEDAVQDAFLSFFQAVERGDYDETVRRDDLWRILSVITVHAARKIRTRELAQKRGGGRVHVETDIIGVSENGTHLAEFFGSVSTAECDLICSEFLEKLDEDLRQIAVLRLAGYSNPQIKDLMQCSLRSIERRMQIIRTIWADYAQ